ncbi:SdpI family protein [Candidatus Corynebacterium faecigallinarum]|uniref:SdpI family protein n=1 Tax=Candidatus Corynebacterium faecigallinarum TaxID=2838528 RepID=UPI003FD0B8E0
MLLSGLSLTLTSSIKSGSLTRNTSIGLRTKATLASDESWDQGHKAALPHLNAMAITGFVGAAVTVVMITGFTISGNGLPGGLIVVPLAGIIVQVAILTKATLDATRAAKKVTRSENSSIT